MGDLAASAPNSVSEGVSSTKELLWILMVSPGRRFSRVVKEFFLPGSRSTSGEGKSPPTEELEGEGLPSEDPGAVRVMGDDKLLGENWSLGNSPSFL